MPNIVQLHRSTDVNAPVLTGQVGSLIALLDVCLKDGPTAASVTSIVESGTTYTVTLGAANGTLVTNDYLTIAGGSPSGVNGTWRITVTDSTHVTFTGPGGLGTITGTITYRKASLGWTKPFSGTNLAAYLPQVVSGFPQHYLRISDNALSAGGAKEAVACGSETMSDINTGAGKYPTTAQVSLSGTDTYGGVCWRKSITADATARPWWLIGDGSTFWLIINSDAGITSGRCILGFGGCTSFKSGDAYNSMISGSATFNAGNPTGINAGIGCVTAPYILAPSNGTYIARSYSQTGGSIKASGAIWSGGVNQYPIGNQNIGILNYPHGPDGALWVQPLMIFESVTICRGRVRGIYPHCHAASFNMNENDIATNVVGLPGTQLIGIANVGGGLAGIAFFDQFGPW